MPPADEAEAWIRAQVAPTGAVEVVHERPWGAVRRVPVAGGCAWFKACPPAQAFEPRLTATLARHRPDVLPEVIARDDERAWLLLGDAGSPLGIGGDPEPWLSVLPRYAELQRNEVAHATEHLAGGVPDRRLATFPQRYDELLTRELPFGGDDRTRLRAFAPRFRELCAELATSGIPETIQHDDLHGANVYANGRTPRILDWGDACVSHAFLTGFVTFWHLDQLSDAWFARLRDTYLEPWGRPAELRETFGLAYRLGPFAHLFKELHVLDTLSAEERPRFAPDLPPILALCVAAAD